MNNSFKNFRLVKKGVDTSPFLKELQDYLTNHDWLTTRSSALYVQQHTLNINLRFYILNGEYPDVTETPLHALVGEIYPFFQNTYDFLETFSYKRKGELCRVMIVSLKPHSQVYKHYDKGSYYAKRDRYHLVLKSSGSKMTSGDENCIWNEGEVWWFDNKLPHEAFNESDEERIHIIFDILPKKVTFWYKVHNFLLKKYALLKYET